MLKLFLCAFHGPVFNTSQMLGCSLDHGPGSSFLAWIYLSIGLLVKLRVLMEKEGHCSKRHWMNPIYPVDTFGEYIFKSPAFVLLKLTENVVYLWRLWGSSPCFKSWIRWRISWIGMRRYVKRPFPCFRRSHARADITPRSLTTRLRRSGKKRQCRQKVAMCHRRWWIGSLKNSVTKPGFSRTQAQSVVRTS